MSQSSIDTFIRNSESQQNSSSDTRDEQETPNLINEENINQKNNIFTVKFDSYPNLSQNSVKESVFNLDLTTVEGTEHINLTLVAGKGGMGSRHVDNKRDKAKLLRRFIGTPVVITGGGGLTTTGKIPYKIAMLTDLQLNDNGIKVNMRMLFDGKRVSNGAERPVDNKENLDQVSRKLGSWQISVPATAEDFMNFLTSLSDWINNKTEYLFSERQKKKKSIQQARETFNSLSIADKVEIPVYSTKLTVVSEKYSTYAKKPKQSLKDKVIEVESIVVDNPNGGYYQLGIEKKQSRQKDHPTCYISGSCNGPPEPNTSFIYDTKFSSNSLTTVTIPNPTDPTIIPPNEEILESPLREPSMQTQPDELQYIGDSTSHELIRICGPRVTADKIAHTLFDDGDIYQDKREEIENLLDGLPHSEKIYTQLKKISQTD